MCLKNVCVCVEEGDNKIKEIYSRVGVCVCVCVCVCVAICMSVHMYTQTGMHVGYI